MMCLQVTALYHEHVLTKEPGTTKRTPWHHDQSYYPIDGTKVREARFVSGLVMTEKMWI